MIVYCGHNEFNARIPWSRRIKHYRDEKPSFRQQIAERARLASPLYRLIEEAADKYRIEQAPMGFVPAAALVDVPSYTPAELASGLADFRRLLEAIVAFTERSRSTADPGRFRPPMTLASSPTRSFLPATTTQAEREDFARDFQVAHGRSNRLTRSEPIKQYRDLLIRQPGFAEVPLPPGPPA